MHAVSSGDPSPQSIVQLNSLAVEVVSASVAVATAPVKLAPSTAVMGAVSGRRMTGVRIVAPPAEPGGPSRLNHVK